ncbi:uncharacterized protein VTP21DRAFT_394 [Calcarisporiella thermophila]|uniref:uncharacterized protein n=1 Tax=Calcarisporiella thermophila TaxID=911321 RepID=UPI00374348D0
MFLRLVIMISGLAYPLSTSVESSLMYPANGSIRFSLTCIMSIVDGRRRFRYSVTLEKSLPSMPVPLPESPEPAYTVG